MKQVRTAVISLLYCRREGFASYLHVSLSRFVAESSDVLSLCSYRNGAGGVVHSL